MYSIRIFKDPVLEFNSRDFFGMLQTLQLCKADLHLLKQQVLQKPFMECYGFIELNLCEWQVDDYLELEHRFQQCGLDTYLIIGADCVR